MNASESPARHVSEPVSAALALLARWVLFGAVGSTAIVLIYFVAVPGLRASSPLSVFFFYVLPAIVLVVSVRALRSSPEVQLSTCLLLIFALGSLYASEAILRAVPMRVGGFRISKTAADSLCGGSSRRQAGCMAAAEAGVPFDSRSRSEVIRDLEAQGLSAWPSIPGSRLTVGDIEVGGRFVYPLSAGIPDELTVLCNESGSWLIYRSDEFGFHNAPGKHRRGEASLAIVGDSYVHGWCVPTAENVATHLSADFENVLNLGWQGSGPLAQLGVVREYAAHLRPDHVAWFFFEGNDLSDLEREMDNEILTGYLAPGYSQGLRELNQQLKDELERWATGKITEFEAAERAKQDRRDVNLQYRASVRSWLSLNALRSRLSALLDSPTDEPPIALPDMLADIAARMRDDVRAWGGELLFVYMPSRERVLGEPLVHDHRDRILEIVDSLQVRSLDLTDVLSGHPDPASLFPFRVYGHLNSEGYRIAASEVTRKIQESNGGQVVDTVAEGNTR